MLIKYWLRHLEAIVMNQSEANPYILFGVVKCISATIASNLKIPFLGSSLFLEVEFLRQQQNGFEGVVNFKKGCNHIKLTVNGKIIC